MRNPGQPDFIDRADLHRKAVKEGIGMTHPSEEAGMVRIYDLRPGDEFTFAPRRGRFRIVGRVPKGNRLVYEGIDAEGKVEVEDKQRVAMIDWWVWKLDPEKEG